MPWCVISAVVCDQCSAIISQSALEAGAIFMGLTKQGCVQWFVISVVSSTGESGDHLHGADKARMRAVVCGVRSVWCRQQVKVGTIFRGLLKQGCMQWFAVCDQYGVING